MVPTLRRQIAELLWTANPLLSCSYEVRQDSVASGRAPRIPEAQDFLTNVHISGPVRPNTVTRFRKPVGPGKYPDDVHSLLWGGGGGFHV